MKNITKITDIFFQSLFLYPQNIYDIKFNGYSTNNLYLEIYVIIYNRIQHLLQRKRQCTSHRIYLSYFRRIRLPFSRKLCADCTLQGPEQAHVPSLFQTRNVSISFE